MPGKHHSKRQKRQAKHVAASEKKRGYSSKQAESIGWATVNKNKSKKIKKNMEGGGSTPPPAGPRRRQIRQTDIGTKQMKPISNAEAAANLRAGVNKAGFQITKKSVIQVVTADDLMKATLHKDLPMQQPRGSGGDASSSSESADDFSKGGLYLSKSARLKIRKPGFKQHGSGIREATDTVAIKEKNPKSTHLKSGKIRKSESDNNNNGVNMSDDNMEDLFKSEIGSDNDKPIIDCPHCGEGITKSDVIAKGKAPHKGGASGGTPARKVAGDNKGGKHHRGPESGANGATPTRYGSQNDGKKKNKDTPARKVVGDNKGGSANYNKTRKGMNDDSSSDDASSGDGSSEDVSKSEQKCPKCGSMAKAGTLCKCGMMCKSDGEFELPPPSMQHPRVRGTAYVQYVDTGEDARIAKMIETGAFGGAQTTQPLDRNNANRR